MKRVLRIIGGVGLGLVVLFLAVQAALAVSGAFDLSWNALFPGGEAHGGAFTLNSAIGQPVVGMSGGSGYELCAGFLCGAEYEWRLFIPLVKR